MIWILAVIALISFVAAVRLMQSRDRYKAALTKAVASHTVRLPGYLNPMTAQEIVAILQKNEGPSPLVLSLFSHWFIVKAVQKSLTQPKPKAQDVPKRYSGAQLRRLADQVNVTQPEMTNSEILSEASNG
jgi:hypothetical protein